MIQSHFCFKCCCSVKIIVMKCVEVWFGFFTDFIENTSKPVLGTHYATLFCPRDFK